MTGVPNPRDALRLVQVLEPLDVRAALVHLLTPCDVAVNMQARVDGDVVRFRGEVLETSGLSWSQVADGLADMMVVTAHIDDEFLDLNAAPSQLLKAVRSGAHTLLSGSELLFGAQCVLMPADADAALVADVASQVASGVRFEAGAAQMGGWDVMILAAGQAVAVAVTGRTRDE